MTLHHTFVITITQIAAVRLIVSFIFYSTMLKTIVVYPRQLDEDLQFDLEINGVLRGPHAPRQAKVLGCDDKRDVMRSALQLDHVKSSGNGGKVL